MFFVQKENHKEQVMFYSYVYSNDVKFKRCIIIFLLYIIVSSLVPFFFQPEQEYLSFNEQINAPILTIPKLNESIYLNWRNLSNKDLNTLSELARRLLLWVPRSNIDNNTNKIKPHDNKPPRKPNFTILIWKFGQRLSRRHIFWYGKQAHKPFDVCSVQNCRITYEEDKLHEADAILFHMQLIDAPSILPKWRHRNQRWIFLTDESPKHTFGVDTNYTLDAYNNLFNWTMTYRMDADIYVPYGRTVPLPPDKVMNITKNFAKENTKMASILMSNCEERNGRLKYVKKLQNYISVDIYGKCGTFRCSKRMIETCKPLYDYKFYLAFENSNCREYITEKLWWNAFWSDSIPVVMGATRNDCEKLLPPKSFIHVEDFYSPKQLAEFLLRLSQNETEYNSYFNWKHHYMVLNEHGYSQSPVFHYCRICEALNYNNPSPKVYKHLEQFWNANTDCFDSRWKLD